MPAPEYTHYIPPEAFGITREEAEAQQPEAGRKSKQWEHFTPDFVGTKSQTLDLGNVFQQIEGSQKLFQEARISQPEGEVKFKNDLPVTIFFIGDVHYGSIYTDHDAFRSHIWQISETPNAFIFLMSNLIDNAIPAQYPTEMMVNAIPPDKQVIAMRKIVEELNAKGKILGAVGSSCHEGWTYKHTGQDVNALIFGFPDRHFPILENGGRLHLQFPNWQRLLVSYHGVGPFESNFNETHALRQMNRLRQNMEADIVAGAHTHVAAAMQTYEGTGENSKPVVYLRTGTYKGVGEINDLWAVGRLATTGEIGGQSVTILPAKKLMDEHLDFETGILAQGAYLGQHIGELP